MNEHAARGNEPDDPWLVDRLLDDPTAPVQDSATWVADLVSALRAPATAGELAAAQTYLRMFDDQTTATKGKSVRTIVIGTRAAVAAAVAVVAVAGAAAAYTGSLPNSLQASAHHYLGAPAIHSTDEPTGSPTDEPTGAPTDTATESPTGAPTESVTAGVGPDATGPAAFGLCTAWSHGGLATASVAYRNLETAAGGGPAITTYCAGVLGTSVHGTGSPTAHQHPTGSPTSHPTGSPTSHQHPTGSPTSHPTGSPSSHPAHH